MSWVLFLIGACVVVPSLLFLARNAGGFSLPLILDEVINKLDTVLEEWLGIFIVPWVEAVFRWLKDNFYLPLNLHDHWRHVFVLMWLFLSAYGKALSASWLDRETLKRFITAFVIALFSSIAAGTVAMTAIAVVFWPLAGFYVFLWLNGLDTSGTSSLRRARSLALWGVAAAWLIPWGFPLFSGVAPSVAIVALAAGVILYALYLLAFGMRGAEKSDENWLEARRSDPGTVFGLSVIVPVVLAVTTIWWTSGQPEAPRTGLTTIEFGDGTFADCELCPRMVRIPAGQFRMGSDPEEIARVKKLGASDEWVSRETPAHLVRVPAFSLGVMEVTRAQFAEYLSDSHEDADGHCGSLNSGILDYFLGVYDWRNPGFRQDDNHPVVCVTHWDAVKYTAWLSRKTGHSYRLPTEAEWEYAARAGTTTSRYWGNGNEEACLYANVRDISLVKTWGGDQATAFPCNDGYAFTAPVGTFKPNAFGLYDMLGNALEWTLDCYRENYVGAPPQVSRSWAESCGVSFDTVFFGPRVVRGGGWNLNPWRVRSAYRNRRYAADRADYIGFRVARTD